MEDNRSRAFVKLTALRTQDESIEPDSLSAEFPANGFISPRGEPFHESSIEPPTPPYDETAQNISSGRTVFAVKERGKN